MNYILIINFEYLTYQTSAILVVSPATMFPIRNNDTIAKHPILDGPIIATLQFRYSNDKVQISLVFRTPEQNANELITAISMFFLLSMQNQLISICF